MSESILNQAIEAVMDLIMRFPYSHRSLVVRSEQVTVFPARSGLQALKRFGSIRTSIFLLT